MIEFNSLSLAGADNSLGSIVNNNSKSSLDSFESQLSAAITTTLEKFGIDPSKISISIGSNANGSNPATLPANTTTTTPATASSQPKSTAATTPDANSTDPMAAIMAYDSSYWDGQPAAVQALRNIDDMTDRSIAAGQLAAEGYKIDVPIMVWGWDPSKVTSMRQSFGYTWVPSAMQTPIQEAPGINDMGGTPYDPNNPPPGSIMV